MNYELRIMNCKSNILKILSLLVIFLIILQGVSFSATYYLDAVNGNDNNPGTSALPWKTLNRAYTWYSGPGLKVQEGDTVLFRNGDYGVFSENSLVFGIPFYRNNWITYRADTGHTPTLTNIDITNIDQWGGAGNGFSCLIFDGFEIPEAVAIRYTSYVQVRNCNIRAEQSFVRDDQGNIIQGPYAPYVLGGAVIGTRAAHYITIENNDISYAAMGIDIPLVTEDSNITIKNNTIHRLGQIVLNLYVKHALIEGNSLSDVLTHRMHVNVKGTKTGDFIEGEILTQAGTDETGIVHSGGLRNGYQLAYLVTSDNRFAEGGGTIIGSESGATITNITKIDGIHTDCIQIDGGGQTDITITGNIIIHNGGVIKLWVRPGGSAISGISFENNLIRGSKPFYGQADVESISVSNINNNTFWCLTPFDNEGITHQGLIITNMYNNIFACQIQEVKGRHTISNYGNNIYWSEPSWFDSSTELVYQPIEDLFVDSANGDFRLKDTSVAIDFGDPAYAPVTDIEGNTRDAFPDAGCYEYGAASLKGDINKDGKVNIQDVQCCVNHIKGTQDWGSNADVNGDGRVDEADVQEIVNIILKQ